MNVARQVIYIPGFHRITLIPTLFDHADNINQGYYAKNVFLVIDHWQGIKPGFFDEFQKLGRIEVWRNGYWIRSHDVFCFKAQQFLYPSFLLARQVIDQPGFFQKVNIRRQKKYALVFDQRKDAFTPLSNVKLLAPSEPTKIVCVGRNYVEHAKELGNEVPKVPLIFLKPPSSIISNGETILLPPQSIQIEHEAELVIVIGKRGRHVTTENAKKVILGYTIGNDVTARDLQKSDGQWTRAKGFDTFCPFRPWIDTDFDPSDAVITCRVNGQMRQMASTRDMVFNVGVLIAYITSISRKHSVYVGISSLLFTAWIF